MSPVSMHSMRRGSVSTPSSTGTVIKDGIVYDARRLLADVAGMVADARKRVGSSR
jgi:hypothetical protein